VSAEDPDGAGFFASTQNRILFGLSALLVLVSAGLMAVVLTVDVPLPLPQLAGQEKRTADAAEPHAATDQPPAAPAVAEPVAPGQPADDGPEAAVAALPPPSAPTVDAARPESSGPPSGETLPAQPPPPLPPLGRDVVGALAPAPDPALVEQSSVGLLPRIGSDGRLPWRVYARPFDVNDERPRVAVVLSALGLSSAATESAIQGLPGGVTLAFQPYTDNLQQWIHLARAAGHEVLINLPLEPLDYPVNDPGPQALFTAFEPAENLDRLNWTLSRVTGYVGVATHMGSRFTTSRDAMEPIMRVLSERGLLFVDTRSSARSVATNLSSELGVPRAINDRFLDAGEISRATIDARLAEVERIAREVGVSVAVGQAYPVTIERIRAWVPTLDGKGLVLAPISAVVNLQADR
jgi:polysaccharide deacetylase 2 family uncharacterized protein YibQ